MTAIKDGKGTQKSRHQQRKERGESWSQGSSPASAPAGPRPARKPDLNACPPGWNADVWHLALYFKQVAEATTRRETLDQKIRLEHGLPLIYAYLERVCDPFREWFSRRQEKIAAGEKLRPIYIGSSRKDVRVAENWMEVVAQAIRWHFRKYHEDEYATDYFCNPEVFRTMIRESRETAYEWHLLARHEENK